MKITTKITLYGILAAKSFKYDCNIALRWPTSSVHMIVNYDQCATYVTCVTCYHGYMTQRMLYMFHLV